jgi:hypothetical protein
VAITMTPSDALVHRFVADLRRRGVPQVNTAAQEPRRRASRRGNEPAAD